MVRGTCSSQHRGCFKNHTTFSMDYNACTSDHATRCVVHITCFNDLLNIEHFLWIPRVEFLRQHSVQAIERCNDRAIDRAIDRATERPSDRGTERSSDRSISGLEVDFWTFWDAIVCATTILLVNDIFETNCSKQHRQLYIDLRHGVHLKHQNLISKISKFREEQMWGSRLFYSLFTGLNFVSEYASEVC